MEPTGYTYTKLIQYLRMFNYYTRKKNISKNTYRVRSGNALDCLLQCVCFWEYVVYKKLAGAVIPFQKLW